MPEPDNIFDFLKPKEMLIYCEESTPFKRKSKQRRVFDEDEITFIYVDFLFYNKLFDEESWEAKFQFRIYQVTDSGKSEITTWDVDKKVSPDENLVIITDYWGDEAQNIYWTEGEYLWEVWYKDIILMDVNFYIEAVGKVTRENNPYLDFLSLKLFTGPSNIPAKDDRKYLTRFRSDMTRFIWAEFEFHNLSPLKDWKGEFVFNFYNDIKELVGSIVKTETVITVNKNNTFTVFAGIGHDTQVTWAEDLYTVEIIFMDNLIAVASFEVSDNEYCGELKVEAPSKKDIMFKLAEPVSDDVLVFEKLDSLIGLNEIKQKLHEYYYFAKYVMLRKEKGIENKDELNLNFVFTGNPGTGKTTVARMLGKLYKSLGLLPKDTVFEVDRADLIGRYIGETAPQTKEAIEKARGGILFIDEAYALYRDDEKDFGHEAIEVLMKELSDGPGNISIIVAGYPKEMKTFLESNTGLKSRFNNWYEFKDYSPNELLDIAKLVAKKKSLMISPEAEQILLKIIVDEYRKRERTFGNARYVTSLVEETQINLGLRIMRNENPADLSLEEISTIEKTDVEKIIYKAKPKKTEFEIDEKLLKQSLNELNSMTGLRKVKAEISETVKLVRFFKETNKDVLNSLSLHNVFIGNPGTGKTTVARILAEIYKALGLLEKGHLVECSRDSLVAGYVGQTPIKTKEKIEEALGGVLFIDEAYSLTRGFEGIDYGSEAVEVIIKSMEDYRGKFSIITAGYTNEMIEFINSNPGFKSRFDNFVEFEDYNPAELISIAEKMLSERKVRIAPDAKNHLMEFFSFQHENKDKFFGNARFVRKVVEKAVKNIYVRLSEIPSANITDDMMNYLTLRDVEEFTASKDIMSLDQRKIGF